MIQLQNPGDPEAQYFFNDLSAEHRFRWMTLLPIQQPWEYAINELHHLLTGPVNAPGQPAAPTRRLAWLIDPVTQQIEVAEQSLRKNGGLEYRQTGFPQTVVSSGFSTGLFNAL